MKKWYANKDKLYNDLLSEKFKFYIFTGKTWPKSRWKFLKKDLTGLQKSTSNFFAEVTISIVDIRIPLRKLKNGEDRFKTIVQQFTLLCNNRCFFLASLFKDSCNAIIPHFFSGRKRPFIQQIFILFLP